MGCRQHPLHDVFVASKHEGERGAPPHPVVPSSSRHFAMMVIFFEYTGG